MDQTTANSLDNSDGALAAGNAELKESYSRDSDGYVSVWGEWVPAWKVNVGMGYDNFSTEELLSTVEYADESYPFQSLIETTYPIYHCEFCHDKHWIIVPDRPNDAHEEPCFCEPY